MVAMFSIGSEGGIVFNPMVLTRSIILVIDRLTDFTKQVLIHAWIPHRTLFQFIVMLGRLSLSMCLWSHTRLRFSFSSSFPNCFFLL
jgi:hypothetical protein